MSPATLTIIVHLAVAQPGAIDACIRAAATIGTQAIVIGRVVCEVRVGGVVVERK